MLLVFVGAATGAYFLVRRIDALSGLLVDRPVLGVLAYAAFCISIGALLLRWGQRHINVVRAMGLAGPLALFSAAMPAIGGFFLLGSLDLVGGWLRETGGAAPVIYAVAFMLLAGCALLPTYAQAILGGWAFGLAVGFPAALVGITGAALIGYAIGAGASGERVVTLIREKPKWEAVRRALAGGGFLRTLGLVTLLRLPMNSPFAVTNLVMSSVRVPLIPYTLGTFIGIAPRTGIAVYLAWQIEGVLDEGLPDQPRWLYFGSIALTVGIVLLIGQIATRAIERVTAEA